MHGIDTSQHERLRRPARIHSLRLGELTVSYVPDGAVQLTPRGWLPDTTDETWAEHPGYLDETGNLVGSLGGLLVELGDRALLIDAGFGPHPAPAQPGNPHGAIRGGALLDSLSTLGRGPADIEAVAFTHLHIDHVGWAWCPPQGSDEPAFGSTPYLVAEPEWSHRELLVDEGTSHQVLRTMQPRVRTVVDGEELFPGVRLHVTHGHTAGHAAYVITSRGRRLIAFGDAMHTPVQVGHPEWSAASDHDRNLSAQYRRRLVAELSEPDTIGFGIHFADVPFGRVQSGSTGAHWVPVDV